MKLLVEIGNTRAKWALADAAGLSKMGARGHRDGADWSRELPECSPESVWFASVAGGAALAPLLAWTAARDLAPPRRIGSVAAAAGVSNAYAEPERLGVDRWLACLAAHQRAGRSSVMVIDAGTALTLDYVAADGQHRGGLIAPGVASMRAALRTDTELRFSDHSALANLGTDTATAVSAGTLAAALGLIERTRAALRPDCLFLTGGEADTVAPYLRAPGLRAPYLVLEGLVLAAAEAERCCWG